MTHKRASTAPISLANFMWETTIAANNAKFFSRPGKNLKLSESMKRWSLHLTFAGAVMALGIFTSCTAQTTHSTRVSEVKDRHNFRDEQEGAPRADNASIER